MHVGVKPDNILERIALASGMVPTPLVESFMGMGMCRVLITAARFGVFEALEDGEKTAAEVTAAIGGHPIGTETLLNALNGFGYLKRRNGRFRNARVTQRWLVASAEKSLHHTLLFFGDLWERMDGIDDAVRGGTLGDFHADGQPPEFWERYMRGLGTFARTGNKEVAKKVKLPTPATRLLDVGGGHGLYAAGFCRKYPALRAEVLDLPGAAAVGRRIVEEEGFADRVTYREGDFRTTEWGEGYDVVLIFNVLHNSTEEEGVQAAQKAFAALRPGGMLVIQDAEHREYAGNVNATAGFNELFFFLLSGTRAWPEATMRGWMEGAGFGPIKLRRLMMLPGVLLTGIRPEERTG